MKKIALLIPLSCILSMPLAGQQSQPNQHHTRHKASMDHPQAVSKHLPTDSVILDGKKYKAGAPLQSTKPKSTRTFQTDGKGRHAHYAKQGEKKKSWFQRRWPILLGFFLVSLATGGFSTKKGEDK